MPSAAPAVPRSSLRSKPCLGRRPELRSGELRPPRALPSPPLDAREPGVRPGALSRRPVACNADTAAS